MSRRLALLLLAGCSSASAAESIGTPYSCTQLAIAPQPGVDHGVVTPWRVLAEADVLDNAWVAHVQALAGRPLPALPVAERVRVQHELLRVARRLDVEHRDNPAWPGWQVAQDQVVAAIRAVAPSARELAILGDGAHPQVAAVLGGELTERATRSCETGSLQHVNAFGGLLAFRPLRAGATRALVAQLVAIDSDGNPHITPLVEQIELRFGDDDSTTPACVVEAGADGVLRAVARDDLHGHGQFVRRVGDGVGCVDCHRGGARTRGYDVGAADLPHLDRARTGQVERLASELWSRVTK